MGRQISINFLLELNRTLPFVKLWWKNNEIFDKVVLPELFTQKPDPKIESKTTPQQTYNHLHSILRLFDVLTNFPFTTIETMCDYYL